MSNGIPGGSSSAAMIANEYDTRVTRISLDQQQQEGQQALALITGSSPCTTPAGPCADGKGAHVNTYA